MSFVGARLTLTLPEWRGLASGLDIYNEWRVMTSTRTYVLVAVSDEPVSIDDVARAMLPAWSVEPDRSPENGWIAMAIHDGERIYVHAIPRRMS